MLTAKMDFSGEPSHGAVGLTANQKIDVCRGLFAILVVSAHAVEIAWSIHPEEFARYPLWLTALLYHVAGRGIYWVIGFFVISGYCIQLSVSRSIVQDSFPLPRYLTARLSRILPIYYLGLVFAVFVERMIASARPPYWENGINASTFIAQLLCIQNLTQTFGSYGASWSITNEMFYYVYYGVVVCVAIKTGVRATMLGMAICVAMSFLMEILHFGFYHTPFTANVGVLFGLGTIWFLGAMIAEYRASLAQSEVARRVSTCWPIIILCGIALWFSQRVHLQVLFVILAAGFSLMLVRFLTLERVAPGSGKGGWSGPAAEILGQSSYPMYVFHGPLLMLVASAILRWRLVSDWRITWSILFLVGITSGVVLGCLVEKPILLWRKAFLRDLEKKGSAAVASGSKVRIAGVQD